MNRLYTFLCLAGLSARLHAQVGINTETPQATLDIQVTNPDTPDSSAGILIPRVKQNPPSGNEKGQLIFNQTEGQFYFWDGIKWTPLAQATATNGTATAYFADTQTQQALNMDQTQVETPVPGASLTFSVPEEKEVSFNVTVNFKGRSSAFAPLFKLKLTRLDDNTSEVIDKASNTFLSDGISDYYGNLPLLSIKKLPRGNYKAEVIAFYNNCCNFTFNYQVGGPDTNVSLLVQHK